MSRPRYLFLASVVVVLAGPAQAQNAIPRPQPGNEEPILRLEGNGPLSPVSALAFGPGGDTLYEAGWDKIVRVWKRDARSGRFINDARSSLRTPIGPGDVGVLNALAVSQDGAWLAVAGNAALPESAGFRQQGLIVPRASLSDPWDQGVIYIFDLKRFPAKCRQVRAHPGPVQALTFATAQEGAPPVLVSAGAEAGADRAANRQELVLRAWDAAAGTSLGAVVAGEFQKFRPWIAAWPSPKGPARTRVAASWTDSSFLYWDVGDPRPQLVGDPFEGRSLVLSYRPDRGELLTGHFGKPPEGERPEGYLASWPAAAPSVPSRRQVISWAGAAPSPPETKSMPVAQALVASRPGGPRDLLAIVLQGWKPPNLGTQSNQFEYRLQIVDLDPTAFGTVRAAVDLWTGPRVQPFAATAPDGGRLAVVGNPDNEIFVYDVPRLLQGPLTAPQKLRGAGESFGTATFVRNKDVWGLRLRHAPQSVRGDQPPPIGPGDDIFDLTNRIFSPSADGWSLSVPSDGAWQATFDPARQSQPPSPCRLWVYENRNPVVGIPLYPESPSSPPESVQVSCFALRPPIAPARDPVAAVALDEPGVGPTLWLYNGRTGERFRQLTGHTGRARSLAFSADGRFLVSSADDRTTCVWSLTDLDRILRARGALPGLVLSRREDGRYVVSEIRHGPYEGRDDLRVGDIIEGIVEGGRLRSPGSVLDIHFTAAGGKPGQKMTLRRRRGTSAPEDVTLVLGQGVDERKPLLTLFVTERGAGRKREWLAWNPFGPYDASGPGIESLFGWHFNEADQPREPARFALATAYPKFRRSGLTRDLINAGRLPPPPAPEPIAPPKIELMFDAEGMHDGRGWLAVRQPPAELSVALDRRVPADRVVSVDWHFDDGMPRPLHADEMFWTADLSGVAWDRKPHKVTVVLQTRGPAQRFTKSEIVRYLPKPPRLIPRTPAPAAALASGIEVEDRRFRFSAGVETEKGVTARARLTYRREGEAPVVQDFGPDTTARPIDATIELKPGANTIELEATNDGAERGLEGDETARFGPLTVNYRPKRVSPPTLALDSLVLLPESPGATPVAVKVAGTDLGVVQVPRVRLEGRVEAKGELRNAEFQYADRAWKPFEGFGQGRETFTFRETLDLVEGRQTIRLRAQADADEPGATRVVTLTIEYAPRVPTLAELAAEPLDALESPGTGGEPVRVKLSAKMIGSEVHHPLDRAVVRVDDEPSPEPPELDRQAGTLSAVVKLPAGTHQIKVELTNRWNTATFGPVTLKYRRPPLIDQMKAELQKGRPFATVSARVASTTAPTKAEIEVISHATTPPTNRTQRPRLVESGGAWAVAGEVALEPGENEIIVRAWNEDGPSPVVTRRLVFVKPVEPKPEVLVLTQESVVRRPASTVRFRARSPIPLTRVELVRVRAGSVREPVRQDFGVEKLERQPDGAFELIGEAGVSLEPYQNLFEVVAVNAGGVSTSELTLSFAPPPVRVEITSVSSDAEAGVTEVPRARPDGPPTLPGPLADGRATIHGQVVWDNADPRLAGESSRLQVWVNGFPQVSAVLGSVHAGKPGLIREFTARVLLSRSKNEIVVKLRDEPLDIHGDPKLALDCRNPDRNSRLHLWVIGINADDERALLRRAVTALQGQSSSNAKNELTVTTPAFPVTTIYGPESKGLTRSRVYSYLKKIAKNIPIVDRPSNDVVMIYYEGGEVIEGKETSLRLRPASEDDASALFPLSELRRHLSETRGAKLFLFDVDHAPDQAPLILAESARWVNDDTPFGVLTFSWPGKFRPAGNNLALALSEALKKATTLGEVSEAMGKQTVAWRRQVPGFQFRPELPASLSVLVIGAP